MKILIIEDQLVDDRSHHLAQIEDLYKCAKETLDAEVEVVANENAARGLSQIMVVSPLLVGMSLGRMRSDIKRYFRPIAIQYRVILNGLRLRKLFRNSDRYDAVLITTTWTPHLVSLLISLFFLQKKPKRVCLQFLCCWNLHNIRDRFSLVWLRYLLKTVRCIVPKLKLLGQTHAVCDDVKGHTNLQIQWMPDVASEETLLSKDDFHEFRKKSSNTYSTVLGFYGFARYEQGADILLRAVDLFIQDYPDTNVIFNIFWPCGGITLPDGSHVKPTDTLSKTDKVRFYYNVVEKQEMLELLRQTDWVILPYRKESYSKRSSLLATNAICQGVPAIYTAGTFLNFLFEEFGAGISVKSDDPLELKGAIKEAVFDRGNLREKALSRRSTAECVFSSTHFWSIALGHENQT